MKIREKTTATLLIAMFMISAFAVAVSANPGINFVGDASYSDTEAYSGTYSVRLGTAEPDWNNWAGVQIPYGLALSTFIPTESNYEGVLDVSENYFYYNIENLLLGQVPIVAFVFENQGTSFDQTWKLILAPPLPTYETGDGEWHQLTDPFTTNHLWRLDQPREFDGTDWGSTPLYEELGWWQLNTASPIKDKIVDAVEVSIGTGSATVYVDDITINGITYPLEAPVNNDFLLDTEVLAPVISFTVLPAGPVDFGSMKPGTTADPVYLTVTNLGDYTIDITAELTIDPVGFYTDNLKMGDSPVPVVDWAVLALLYLDTGNADLSLTIPISCPPGDYPGTLVFWAEAIEYVPIP